MTGFIIGLTSSVITILLLLLLKRADRIVVYGIVLAGIGFLYVGYTWTNITIALVSGMQVIFFITFAWFGIKKDLVFLVAGYFLHGLWDIVYDLFGNRSLLPPHYDAFCSTYDFVVAIYLWILKNQIYRSNNQTSIPQAAH
jgi:hypothetical protein